MAKEITVAREASVRSLNAQSSTSAARRQSNPFSSITTRPISASQRAYLESEGVNMRIYEQTRVDERNRRIDYEYDRQVKQLRDNLNEKYSLASYAGRAFTNDRSLLAQAKEERKAYNRELAQGIKRLKRLAAAAKRK